MKSINEKQWLVLKLEMVYTVISDDKKSVIIYLGCS